MRTTRQNILISRNRENIAFPVENIVEAVMVANRTFIQFSEINENLDLFSILGMRNLSAFIGEVYVASLAQQSDGILMKNPHQDGYPDLLLLDDYGRNCLERIPDLHDKSPFSPFLGGGIEVKATCGAVPKPAACRRRGFSKPEIGDTRAGILTDYDWKAHHRETNNLIGLLWDFANRVPEIVALFYSSSLTTEDWGNIVQPREGGGRTTSVSIMTRVGVRKMAQGCLYCKDNPVISAFVENYNHISLTNVLQQG